MSENELDKTLAHAIQPHDKVHRATSPQQLQSQFPNLEAAVHYQSNIDSNPAGIRQNYYRIPRNFQPPQSTTNKDGPRVCTSLPLYLTKSDLCTLVPRPGMEYVPLRTPAAEPYHYHHVTDQTKSLQELQNEVGALLEFRDLVIETFPDLKSKMASSAANSTLTGISSSSSSLAIRREWEPGGIRIRRKLIPKDTGSGSIGGGGSSSTTIIPGGGGSNGGSISSNHSNTAGLGASSGSAPAVASVAGSSGGGTTTTVLNHHLQQQQQQQHSHQHHHHHHQHHHTQTQHGSNSSGNHPHQQQQQQQQQHSSSSLIRSRSNSHSGKKEPKSGEGNNGSVIQDSGFSTETSSSKETHSAASSTSGAGQGGLILSTTINRLAVETEDELWNLLDVIHRKGSRLREEVDLHLEREKSRATNLAINHPPHHHHAHHHPPHLSHPHHQQQHVVSAVVPPPSTSSGAVASAGGVATAPVPLQTHHHGPTAATRIGGSSGGSSSSHSSSSSSGNNITIHHSNPAATTATSVVASADAKSSTTTTTVIVSGAGPTVATSAAAAKSFQSQLLHTTDPVAGGGVVAAVGGGQPPVDHNVQILRNERDRLLDKLSTYEAETFAGRIREAKMHDELETLTLTMRELQEQLKVANSQKVELNSKLHDLHLQTVNRSAPSSPESIKVRQQQQQHTPIPPPPASSASLASSSPADAQQSPAHALRAPSRYHLLQGNGKSSAAPPPLPPLDDPALVEDPKTPQQPVGGAAGLGRLDALLGSPPRLQKVRTLDSKKIAAILLETNIVELQRHLLTVTVQNQILQQRLEQATRSRLFLSEKFEKSKEDLDDLRFQLMEKSIELEGTKAQLRVIESKSASGGKSAPPSAETSPEHHLTAAGRGATGQQQHQQQQHHHNAGHLMQHHQLHHHHQHHHHHHQHHANVVSSVTVNSQLAMRLPSSQVSTPSMKAMTPVAMDDMIALHHSSSTESAQDQAERDISIGGNRLHQQQQQQQQQTQHQAPETPRRRPSKIPLPGTKGSAAPKPPSGRNFSATPTPTTPTGPSAMQRPLGGGGSSGPSSNRSLTKSTGSLYVRSVDAGSFGAAGQHPHAGAGATTGAGSSWRNSSSSSSNNSKETPSLEKSRSSSIPISSSSAPKLVGGAGQPPPISPPHRPAPTMMTLPPPPIPPTAYGGVISSSPLPRPKRDTLTTKVKNCDSLSRKQSLRKDAPSPNTNATSIGSGQSSTSAVPPAPAIRERKPSAGGGGGGVLRHASSTSLGSADTPSSATGGTNGGSATSNTTTTPSDNGKARRSNTFRLAKSTLTPLLLATGPPGPGFIVASPLPGIGVTGTKPSGSVEAATAISHRGNGGSARTRSKTSTGGTTAGAPPAVVRASFSTPSMANVLRDEDAGGERVARNLIGEYLAAKKTKCDVQLLQQQQQQHQMSIPPPIFHVHQLTSSRHINQQHQQREMEELAYKHPILLKADEDEEDEEVALGGASRPLDSEDDSSIELVLQDDSRDDQQHSNMLSYGSKNGDEDDTSAANESLIVPRPKMIAFHSLKGTKEGQRRPGSPTTVTTASTATCRLVGKVNPNILKTWEQLSGQQAHNSCVHQQQRSASTGRLLLLAEAAGVGTTGTVRQPLRRTATAAASSSGCLYFDTETEHDDDDDDQGDDGESADERQSCLLYCPQQRAYPHDEGEREEEDVMIEFKVNKLQHHPAAATTVSDSRTTSSGHPPVGSTSSEGVDFYDSIDADSTPLPPGTNTAGMLLADDNRPPENSYTDLPSVAGGEGLAEFTSIDRKRLWSIEISEQ